MREKAFSTVASYKSREQYAASKLIDHSRQLGLVNKSMEHAGRTMQIGRKKNGSAPRPCYDHTPNQYSPPWSLF